MNCSKELILTEKIHHKEKPHIKDLVSRILAQRWVNNRNRRKNKGVSDSSIKNTIKEIRLCDHLSKIEAAIVNSIRHVMISFIL
ncbi:hypothetical protein HZS_7927 [Henneguya salminicola]|nr:hypothetical protein HZS_7927 [Henneguya salminicola]